MALSTSIVSPADFPHVILENSLVVWHCWAGWDTYDRLMNKVIVEVENQFAERVFFGCVDVDDLGHEQRCRELRIRHVSAVIIYSGSRHVETLIGLKPEEALSGKIKMLLPATRA